MSVLRKWKRGTVMAPTRNPVTYGVVRVELDVTINAALERVWKALVDETSAWWPKDFYTSPTTQGFVLEPRLGGRVYEDWGAGAGLLWFTVIGINPPVSLTLLGHLTPTFGGPATTMLELILESVGETVVLHVTETMSGRAEPGSETTLREGWVTIFDGGLRAHVEGKP
jgi:uncharacterized protein YndB with AHSA1/START domain